MDDPMIVRKSVYNFETKTWEKTDEWVDLNKVNVFDQDRMEESVEDGTEGGYIVTESVPLTAEEEERYDRWATELGRDCPNPDCICKKGNDG